MPFVEKAVLADVPDWLRLAQEVEPLFGPMIADPAFREGLDRAIAAGDAFCVRTEVVAGKRRVCGGIVISREQKEILWLAVCRDLRGSGIGTALLSHAIAQLGAEAPVWVTTFDDTVEAGAPARALYRRFGFRVLRAGGTNPAGVPTVVMLRGDIASSSA